MKCKNNKNDFRNTSNETKVLFTGFGKHGGTDRATSATEVVLLALQDCRKTLEKVTSISIQIAYGTKEITIAELQIITDAVQEKLGNTYAISIHLSENKTLKNKLSVTLEICGS